MSSLLYQNLSQLGDLFLRMSWQRFGSVMRGTFTSRYFWRAN